MTKYCYVCRKVNAEVKHRLPNPKRVDLHVVFDKWVDFIDNPKYKTNNNSREHLYKTLRVCDKHFKVDDFVGVGNRTLHYLAVPSIRLDAAPSTSHEENIEDEAVVPDENREGCTSAMSHYSAISSSSSTKPDVQVNALKRKVKRMKSKQQQLQLKLKRANNIITNHKFQSMLNRMSQEAATFIKCQIRQDGKLNKGDRFTSAEKVFSLTLFKQSAKAYRHLRQVFALPSASTIREELRKLSLTVGINQAVVEYLRHVTKGLSSADRCCCILFDEIFLKPGQKYNSIKKKIEGFEDYGTRTTNRIADHALVFMVRGLQNNWKFPFAYYFTEGGMKTIDLVKAIKDVVTAVQSCDLEVLAVVCDQGASNAPALNYLKNETKGRYLRRNMHYPNSLEINDKEILIIFDPPHLLKGFRNNLLNMDLRFSMNGQECVTSWKHVVQAYDADKNNDVRAIPKLCHNHVVKSKIKKMKVKYFSQIFSQRVALHMMILAQYAPADIIDKDAKHTATLLDFLDKLFDSVISSQFFVPGKPMRSCVKEDSDHVAFWRQSIETLKSMHFLKIDGDKTKQYVPPTIRNWIITLGNLVKLWDVLQGTGYRYFVTRRINQDPLENFFAAIRSRVKFNTRPTTTNFTSAFKTLMINNVTSTHSINANCEDDQSYGIGKSLSILLGPEGNDDEGTRDLDEQRPVQCDSIVKEVSQTNLITNFSLAYVTGYFLKRNKKLFMRCNVCKEALIAEQPSVFHSLIEKREYTRMRHSMYPTVAVMNIVDDLKSLVMNAIPIHCNNVNCIIDLLQGVDFDFWDCSIHKNQVMDALIHNVCDIFTYRWCRTINLILNGKFKIDTAKEKDVVKIQAQNKYIKIIRRRK